MSDAAAAAARSKPSSDYVVGHGGRGNLARDQTQRYYELNDTWMLKSGATVDEEAAQRVESNSGAEDGITRTVAFEQAVYRS